MTTRDLVARLREVGHGATEACNKAHCRTCDVLIGQLSALALLAADEIERLRKEFNDEMREAQRDCGRAFAEGRAEAARERENFCEDCAIVYHHAPGAP
jgi:hypothetical protein